MPRFCIIAFCLCVLLVGTVANAVDLYQNNLNTWKAHTKSIEGREFKFLADPAKLPNKPVDAFKTLWNDAKLVAEKNGIVMTERDKKPFELTPTIKTFFDTPAMDLWKKGYLIRLTTNFKNGYSVSPIRVTVKAINPSFQKALAVPLQIKGVKGKLSAEENVGIGKNNQLAGYVEKGLTFSLTRGELKNMDLADFAAYVPELAKLGLPADTKLIAYSAYGVRCRPGFVQFPGLEKPVAVSMESWARGPHTAPFVYDYSFGYDGLYDKMAEAHKIAEKFTLALYAELNTKLGLGAEAIKWNGSKARLLLNQGF